MLKKAGNRIWKKYVPFIVRNARQMRRDLWPSICMLFRSILILAAALAILSYRVGRTAAP